MLTTCPDCGTLHGVSTEDAMSPNERDRRCAPCFWCGEVNAGRAQLDQANAVLSAHGHPMLRGDDLNAHRARIGSA